MPPARTTTLPRVRCPSCGVEFRLEEAFLGPIRQQIEGELRPTLESEVSKRSSDAMQELEGRLEALETENKGLKDAEKQLRAERRRLEKEKADFDLEVARAVDAERKTLAVEARETLGKQHELALHERDETIRRLNDSIKELQDRASQAPNELRGTAQELALDERLRSRFPDDEVARVARGRPGGDVVQHVRDASGATIGTILWESKRAQRFDKGWIPKLKEDAGREHADVSVLVTSVPADERDTEIAERDGVWVVSLELADALAAVLRSWLLAVAHAKNAVAHRGELADHVYDYVSGSDFVRHLEGAFVGMRKEWSSIQSEREVLERRWSEREAALKQQVKHLVEVVGDLQGIGAELERIPKLELAALGSGPARLAQGTSTGESASPTAGDGRRHRSHGRS